MCIRDSLHGVWILLCVLLIPGIMELIPLASLAAILFLVGYKLAKPALFVSMWKKGWEQFVPFMVTIIGVVFIDLLKGVMLGMAVGIFIVLRNNYLTPYRVRDVDGEKGGRVRLELSEEVTFFNKASIQRTLARMPRGTHVIIDASRTVNLDPDVKEIIDEEIVRSEDQGIAIELVGTLMIPAVVTPFAFMWRSAASVSAVSPDCETTTPRTFPVRTGSR